MEAVDPSLVDQAEWDYEIKWIPDKVQELKVFSIIFWVLFTRAVSSSMDLFGGKRPVSAVTGRK